MIPAEKPSTAKKDFQKASIANENDLITARFGDLIAAIDAEAAKRSHRRSGRSKVGFIEKGVAVLQDWWEAERECDLPVDLQLNIKMNTGNDAFVCTWAKPFMTGFNGELKSKPVSEKTYAFAEKGIDAAAADVIAHIKDWLLLQRPDIANGLAITAPITTQTAAPKNKGPAA